MVLREALDSAVREGLIPKNPADGTSPPKIHRKEKQVLTKDELETFMKLAAAMNKMAQTQKRVQAKATDDSNEKYALRVWLVRLGLNGPDCKAERKILMEHLSGHAAFRTKADEEKWKARQHTKKLALKAAKEETAEAE